MAKDKKKDGKKAEKSAQDTSAESSSKLTDSQGLRSLGSGMEETQANPVIAESEEAEEPPVQDVPQYYEEPVLAVVIVKRYACYKCTHEVRNSHLTISGVPNVIQRWIWLLI